MSIIAEALKKAKDRNGNKEPFKISIKDVVSPDTTIKKAPNKTYTTGHIKLITHPRTNLNIIRIARQSKNSRGIITYHLINQNYSIEGEDVK